MRHKLHSSCFKSKLSCVPRLWVCAKLDRWPALFLSNEYAALRTNAASARSRFQPKQSQRMTALTTRAALRQLVCRDREQMLRWRNAKNEGRSVRRLLVRVALNFAGAANGWFGGPHRSMLARSWMSPLGRASSRFCRHMTECCAASDGNKEPKVPNAAYLTKVC